MAQMALQDNLNLQALQVQMVLQVPQVLLMAPQVNHGLREQAEPTVFQVQMAQMALQVLLDLQVHQVLPVLLEQVVLMVLMV